MGTYSPYSPLAWVDGSTSVPLSAANLNKHESALAVASAYGPTHLVHQSGGQTIARRADGTVLSSLATSAANNPTVIQAAIDDGATAAPSSNVNYTGAHLYIAAGDYAIGAQIVRKPHVGISGMFGSYFDNWNSTTQWGTILRSTSALGTTPMMLFGTNGGGTRVAANPHGVWTRSLVLDTTASTGHCVSIVDTAFTIFQDCLIRPNGSSYGIEDTGSTGYPNGSYDLGIYDCALKGGARNLWTGPAGGASFAGTDGIIMRSRIMSATHCLDMNSGGWLIIGNHITHGNAGYLIYSNTGPDMVTIVGNFLDSGTNAMIYLKSGVSSVIQSNHFYNDTAYADPTGAVLVLPWGKVACTGNTFMLRPGSTGVKGFIATGDATKGLISKNCTFIPAGNTSWVAPVVNLSGVAVADRSDGSSYIGENLAWT